MSAPAPDPDDDAPITEEQKQMLRNMVTAALVATVLFSLGCALFGWLR